MNFEPRRYLNILIFDICLLSVCMRAFAQAPDFQRIDRSIVDVQVTCPFRADDDGLNECSGRATGVVLSERHGVVRILTALHEVHGVNADPNAKIAVKFAFDQIDPVPAKLLPVSNSQLDLAVLQATLPTGASGAGTMPLVWATRADIPKNSQLWTVDGLWKPMPGSLVSIVRDEDGERLRYITEASNGYSGGPVLDGSGKLIGIHLRTRAEIGHNLRDAVMFEAAVAWLRSLGYTDESTNRLIEVSISKSLGATNSLDNVSKLRPLSPGDRGTLLYRAGRYQQALPLLTQAALAGDAHAATILGGMYIAGEGVAVDVREADRWWLVGAHGGEPAAMTPIAAAYVNNGNYLLGESWYRKAADLGNVQAMTGLGLLFSNGQITPDGKAVLPHPQMTLAGDRQAVYWYRRASQGGSSLAKTLLGILYANGRGGLQRDYIQAVRLYRAAADSGDASGMECLAQMYLIGRGGLPQDRNQALLWYRRAAALGDKFAIEKLRMFPRN